MNFIMQMVPNVKVKRRPLFLFLVEIKFMVVLLLIPLLTFTANSQSLSASKTFQKAQDAYRKSQLDEAVNNFGRAAQNWDSAGNQAKALKARFRQIKVVQLMRYRKVALFDSLWTKFNKKANTYQDGPSIHKIRAQYAKARQLIIQNEDLKAQQEAIGLLQKARKQLKQLKKTYYKDLVRIHINQGGASKTLKGTYGGHMQKAFQIANEKEVTNKETLARSYLSYGKFLKAQNLRDSTRQVLKKGLAYLKEEYAPYHFQAFNFYRLIGKQYGWELNLTKAKDYYDTAYHVLSQNGVLNSQEEAMLQIEFGYYEQNHKKRFHKALSHYQRAGKILSQKDDVKTGLAIRTYGALADMLKEFKRYEKALKYANKALKIWEKAENSMGLLPSKIQALTIKGFIYSGLENYQKAQQLRKEALNLVDKFPKPIPGISVSIYLSLGMDYIEMGKYDKAEHFIRKSKPLYWQLAGKNDPTVGHDVYYHLAEGHYRQNHFDSAFHFLEKAKNLNRVKGSNPLNQTSSGTNQVFDYRYAFEYASLKGKIHHKLYEKRNNISNLKASLAHFRLADTFYQALRQSVLVDEANQKISAYTRQIYPEGVAVSYDLHQKQDKAYKLDDDLFDQAYRFAEKNRAFALSGKMARLNLTDYGKLPDSLTNQIRQCKRQIKLYTDSLQKAQKQSKSIKFKNKRLFYLGKKDELYQTVKDQFPALYQSSFKQEITPSQELQARLAEKEANLVEYVIGDGKGYALVITPKNRKIIELTVSNNLAHDIQAFRKQSFDEPREFNAKLAHAFYEDLLKPLEPFLNAKKTVIIPDGAIGYLPFSLLLKEMPKNENYAQYPYLIRNYTFSYAPSATMWFTKKDEKNKEGIDHKSATRVAFSGFSPDFGRVGKNTSQLAKVKTRTDTLRDKFRQLPGAKLETTFSAKQWDGQKYMDQKATEARFKEIAPQSRIIHLATHGVIHDYNPAYSKLMFANGPNSGEDGALYNYEIYNMDLNADLAVLSACRTGYGKLMEGEGVMSLARGFKIAGCKNVLMTLWSVEDRAASELVKQFYQNLADGLAKETALRKAKLAYLEANPGVGANPYYWGGFVMMGSDVKVPEPDQSMAANWWLISIGGALFLVVLTISVLIRRTPKKRA